MANEPEEEDDYLNMTFDDPVKSPSKETSLQRTSRLKKGAAERGRVPSKKELVDRATAAREAALATQLDASNKGAQMMAKMGFKGGALGKAKGARTQPIELMMREGRGGIGIESEKKRKIREAAAEIEGLEKRQKVDADEYRERTRIENLERRAEGQMWSAMRILEGFESGVQQGDDHEDRTTGEINLEGGKVKIDEAALAAELERKPLKSINILCRLLVKQRRENERARRMRHDLEQSLSRSAQFDDPDADEDDQHAFGDDVQEIEENDEELDEFEALPAAERLERVVKELREKYRYCFWCKYRYPDAEMDGCPGLTEDEHG